MGKIDHSSAGALYAIQKNAQIGKILAYLIAGHHAGLPDWEHEAGVGGSLSGRLNSNENLQKALQGKPPQNILDVSLPTSKPFFTDFEAVHVWVRMLYSCLVDADYLDTESFMDPDKSDLRGNTYTLKELKVNFDSFMADKQKQAHSSPVNQARKTIFEDCTNQAGLAPGIFSLTVPTGGGKTLSAMAFALNHAIKYGKKRIIVAIPYTSIIEQTADVYRQVFGNDAVLEHHSNFDSDTENSKANLATENWDAPIIVTTNVQLFESLFAARSSACRKLHNIVNSVIVLDEAQMLPTDYLQPIVSVLKVLTEFFKTSVVLCTATQPVLSGRIGSGQKILKGFSEGRVQELMSDPDKLFGIFQRVTIQMLGSSDERQEWKDIAKKLCDEKQALCIVNTRNDCRELHGLMPKGTVHLSALMCPEHRSEVIAGIKSKLKENTSVHVISTQLLEAGVDIDFPVVFRAFTGLDSIAQAAGRCNREGRLDKGQVFVFNPPKPPPSGMMLKAEQAGQEMFRVYPELAASLMPEAFRQYFHLYFNRLNDFDKKSIMDLLAGPDARQFKIQFRTAALRFKLIDDSQQHGLVVRYQSGTMDNKKLIDQLRFVGPSRGLMRKLQRFSVNVYDRDLQEMRKNGMIEEVNGIWVQASNNLYDPIFGLNVKATPNLYW
ncbi:MAG: CRISPR-associated helicase Cas3' [Chlorobium sp.]|nr:MAG: CRISPR-associated helicase Cas3' [Chlorobium sp.]